MFFKAPQKKGVALFVVLGVIGVMVISAFGYSTYSSRKRRIARSLIQSAVLDSLLDSSIQIGFKALQRDLDNRGDLYYQILQQKGDEFPGGKIAGEIEEFLGVLKGEVSEDFFNNENLHLLAEPIVTIQKEKGSFTPSQDLKLHGTDPLAQYGKIDLSITLRYQNLEKTRLSTREFKLVHLNAPVVSKFTLFVSDFNISKGPIPLPGGGGSRNDFKYNCVPLVYDQPSRQTGIPPQGQRPLLLFNSYQREGMPDLLEKGPDNKDFKDYENRGWVFLNSRDPVYFKRAGGDDLDQKNDLLFSQTHHGNSVHINEIIPRIDSEIDAQHFPPITVGGQKYYCSAWHLGYSTGMFRGGTQGGFFFLYVPEHGGKAPFNDMSTFLHLFGNPADRSITRVIGPIYEDYLVLRGVFLDLPGGDKLQSLVMFFPFLEKNGSKLSPNSTKNFSTGFWEPAFFKKRRMPILITKPVGGTAGYRLEDGFIDQYETRAKDATRYLKFMSQPKRFHYNDIYFYIHTFDKENSPSSSQVVIDLDNKQTMAGDSPLTPGKGPVEIKNGVTGQSIKYSGPNELANLKYLGHSLVNQATYVLDNPQKATDFQSEFESYFFNRAKMELDLKGGIVYINSSKPITIPDNFTVTKPGVLICKKEIKIGTLNQSMQELLTIVSLEGKILVNNGTIPVDRIGPIRKGGAGSPPKFSSTRFGAPYYRLSLVALSANGGVKMLNDNASFFNLGNIAVKKLEPQDVKGGGILHYYDVGLDPTRKEHAGRYSIKMSEFSE